MRFIDAIFTAAVLEGLSKPSGAYSLPAIFNRSENEWASQAMHQQHATTYQTEINSLIAK